MPWVKDFDVDEAVDSAMKVFWAKGYDSTSISDLTEALEAERYRLPPETVELIEENLRIIDVAIEQSLTALREAPESLPLQQAVMTSYERKLDFLRQAAAITADG